MPRVATTKVSKIRHATATEPPQMDRCLIYEIPIEVVEMIIANINPIDLVNFISTSKSTFHATHYSRQYQVILQYERVKYATMLQGMRDNPNVHWRVHDLFNAFMEDFCECGNAGSEILWINRPPKRLCSDCISNDEYRFNALNKMLRHYGLTKKDVKHVPTIISGSENYGFYRKGTIVAQQRVVKEIAKAKNSQTDKLTLSRSYYGYGSLETILLDARTGLGHYRLWCGGCPIGSSKELPYKFQPLREHIASAHPEALKSFEAGWEILGPELQKEWLRRGCITTPQGFKRVPEPIPFQSWAHVLQDGMETSLPNPIASIKVLAVELKEFIRKQFEHPESFFNLPVMPGFGSRANSASRSLEHRITYRAANEIILAEMSKAVARVKQDIEENGLEALRRYYGIEKLNE